MKIELLIYDGNGPLAFGCSEIETSQFLASLQIGNDITEMVFPQFSSSVTASPALQPITALHIVVK